MRSRRIPSADWGTDALLPKPAFALRASARQPSYGLACRAEAAEPRRLEDQVGLEPAKLTQRLKKPLPLPLGSLIRNCWRTRVVTIHGPTG